MNRYSCDCPRAVWLYQRFDFFEAFRTPETDPIDHIEPKSDGFTLGITSFGMAAATHKLHLTAG